MRVVPALLALALAMGLFPTVADAASQERLIELDQIAISHEICGFSLSDAQSDALGAETDTIIEALDLTPEASQRLYSQYVIVMQRQKVSGLCDPKGEWARTYARLVGALGQP